MTAPSSTPAPDSDQTANTRRSARASGREDDSRATTGTRLSAMQREIRNASASQLPGVLYRSLECPDPNERGALVAQCLAAMDASNWQTCLGQYWNITRETGRTHREEWERCLFRAGQVAGEEAMNAFKGDGLKNKTTESWNAMYGWATTDPKGALKWLDQLRESDPSQWHRLLPALAAGATLMDPQEGIRLMESLPEDERRNCVGHATWNIVQNGGLDQAMNWMKEVTQGSGDNPGPYARSVTNEVFNKVTSNGTPADMAARMEQIHAFLKVDDARIAQAMDHFGGPTGGLDLLAELSRGPVLQDQADAPTMLPEAISNAVERNPAKLAEWFERNPTAPFLPSAAIQACQQLQARGMTSEVERILLAIPEGASRSAVRSALSH
ncbi:hypothetical protein [Luteolibacter sp. LG18]|uniref:hypothetical protein n=1 Tax=Luteolibacter sp. LG18 TaxID=2819286 RepID=UPI0030C76D5F